MATLQEDRLGSQPGLGNKAPCVCATTANITLSGTQEIDGVTVAAGDRVLVKDQTEVGEDGIYVVRAGNWDRAPDWNNNNEVKSGILIPVGSGTAGTGLFQATFSGEYQVGVTDTTFTKLA